MKKKKKIKKQWVVSDSELIKLIAGSWNEYTETIVYKAGGQYYVFKFYPEGSSFVNCTKKILKLKEEGKW